ncbi:hypothetical protein N0V88_000933 [Collariella sp. IMI 366227]|nr:hypothetical protein N0V88_000933 [Collariella sp. IMI 366227]
MASVMPSPSWRKIQIPRPLQQLFDYFPLRTYEPNALPERSQQLTSSDLPTLYVFSTDEDARLGLPSFNPGCLKWQKTMLYQLRRAAAEQIATSSSSKIVSTGAVHSVEGIDEKAVYEAAREALEALAGLLGVIRI